MKIFPRLAALLAAAISVAAATPALAQEACPTGLVLYGHFQSSAPSSDNARARAILYWQDIGSGAVGRQGKITSSIDECRNGQCGTDSGGDLSAMEAFDAFHIELAKYKAGNLPEYPPATGLEAPPAVMVEWAQKQLNCTIGSTWAERSASAGAQVAAATAPAPVAKRKPTNEELLARTNIVNDWEFYEMARFAGGPAFYRWWDANKKMRNTQDAYDMCMIHKPTSFECTAPKQWADIALGKVQERPTQTFNGQYSDYGNNPYNAGSPNVPRTPAYRAPSNQPRCYNQGDGTEKCFYD